MWESLITTGWHPHKIETYEYLWQYALHPITILVILILLILAVMITFYWDCVRNWEHTDAPYSIIIAVIAIFAFFLVPYVLAALIFTWPLWVGLIIILSTYKLHHHLKNKSPKVKKQSLTDEYKQQLLNGLN